MPKEHNDNDNDNDDVVFSDTSSSVSSVDHEKDRDRRRRSKKSKSHRSRSRSRDRDRDRDRDERDGDDRRRHKSDKKKAKRRHKHSRKDRKKRDRKRRKHDDDESSSQDSDSDSISNSNRNSINDNINDNISDSDSDSEREYSRHRRHKRSKKERKRRRKEIASAGKKKGDGDGDDKDRKKSRKEARGGDDDEDEDEDNDNSKNISGASRRAQTIATTLHETLIGKTGFAKELPLILIRLAGGTTFDLSQVTDPTISHGLRSVFGALEAFGVKQQPGSGAWMFENPPGARRRDELVLLRVIRSLLDEVGLTMDAVERFEREGQPQSNAAGAADVDENENDNDNDQPPLGGLDPGERHTVRESTMKLLEKFLEKDATLDTQLATLCKTIVEGESVCLDGIPDEELRTALETLFETCGLVKSEIENEEDDDDSEEDDDDGDDDDDDGDDDSPLMGYGIPDDSDGDNAAVQMKLAVIMAACREGPPKRKAIGPMRRPMTAAEEQAANTLYASNVSRKQRQQQQQNDDDEEEEVEEDEGPLLPGEARPARGPALSLDAIRARAEHRELQLRATAAGVDLPVHSTGEGQREEWMIVPGQHDFLAGIKSGQAIHKSRGFRNKKSRDAANKASSVPAIHPAVRAEMDAIMRAHQTARGPSLMDLHRSKKSRENEEAARASNGNGNGNGKKKEWKWSRDNDLDAGRRVDKDALGMILGGAQDDLKSKFAGGFNR